MQLIHSPLLWCFCHKGQVWTRDDMFLDTAVQFLGKGDGWPFGFIYVVATHAGTFSSDTVIVIPQPPFNLQRHPVTADR